MFELENALDEYLSHLRIERGASPRTAEAYRRDLERYLAFLDEQGVGSCDAVTPEIIAAFEKRLAEEGLATTTVRRRISAVRGYHRFLVREGLTESNPAEAVDIPKAADVLPDVLSIEEVGRMLDAYIDERPSGLRDRAILEVLYGCGLRASEICGLNLDNLYLDDGFLRVFGKGSQERPSGPCAPTWPRGARPLPGARPWATEPMPRPPCSSTSGAVASGARACSTWCARRAGPSTATIFTPTPCATPSPPTC